MDYYLVHDGKVLVNRNNEVIGKGGEIVPLATDHKDATLRKEAEGILVGQYHSCTQVSKPGGKKKKATYKTKEATPEG
jgi:hypothetical protein